MSRRLSAADLRFRAEFESGDILPSTFDHQAHVRLVYVHLCGAGPDATHGSIREALLTYLARHGIDPVKYHETRTWVRAVRHFMDRTPGPDSADEFTTLGRW